MAANDTIDAMCENAGLQWNQLSKLAAATIEETLLEVDEIARIVLKTRGVYSLPVTGRLRANARSF